MMNDHTDMYVLWLTRCNLIQSIISQNKTKKTNLIFACYLIMIIIIFGFGRSCMQNTNKARKKSKNKCAHFD